MTEIDHDRIDIDHVARLARLGLSEEDKEKLAPQLKSITDLFKRLAEIDTDGVEPTTTLIGSANIMAEDETQPSLSQAEVLANAPKKEDGYIRIKRVLD